VGNIAVPDISQNLPALVRFFRIRKGQTAMIALKIEAAIRKLHDPHL